MSRRPGQPVSQEEISTESTKEMGVCCAGRPACVAMDLAGGVFLGAT